MLRSDRRRRLPAIGAFSFAIIATPASATDVCAVQKSADGYVALRATASAEGAILARAKAGEAVVIQKIGSGDQMVRGSWLRVFYFPGEVIPPTTDPEYKKGRSGWMHKRYINDCG